MRENLGFKLGICAVDADLGESLSEWREGGRGA